MQNARQTLYVQEASAHGVNELRLFSLFQLNRSQLHRPLEICDCNAAGWAEHVVIGEKVIGTEADAVL